MSLSVNIKKKIEGFTLDVAFEAENEFFAVLGESANVSGFTISTTSWRRMKTRMRSLKTGVIS